MKRNRNGYELDDKGRLVHRQVWLRDVGFLPPLWEVRHIDRNKRNNDVENLIALPARINAGIDRQERGGKKYTRKELLRLHQDSLSAWLTVYNHRGIDGKAILKGMCWTGGMPASVRKRWQREWKYWLQHTPPTGEPPPEPRSRVRRVSPTMMVRRSSTNGGPL